MKILDFGLAKPIQPKDLARDLFPRSLIAGVAMGTVGYMSPNRYADWPLGPTYSFAFANPLRKCSLASECSPGHPVILCRAPSSTTNSLCLGVPSR